ncbi:MAG: hypothetical protein QOE31_985 [Solirubrobacteraceae bacterium]|nr:hypothetical protein [Solirubrobacteraceae bacterium]
MKRRPRSRRSTAAPRSRTARPATCSTSASACRLRRCSSISAVPCPSTSQQHQRQRERRRDAVVSQLGRRWRRRARRRPRLHQLRRLRVCELVRREVRTDVRAQPLPARRLLEPPRRDRRPRRELDRGRRGPDAHAQRGRVRGPPRVVVAGVQEPEPLPRADVPVLQAQQVPDDPLGARRHRAPRRRPGRADAHDPQRPAADRQRVGDPRRDPRDEQGAPDDRAPGAHERRRGRRRDRGRADRELRRDADLRRRADPAGAAPGGAGCRRRAAHAGGPDRRARRRGVRAGAPSPRLGAHCHAADGGRDRQVLPRRLRRLRAGARPRDRARPQRRALENELLKKQIMLLDKAQEYRCCPVGEDEPDA